MRALITGGSGYFGSLLVTKLLSKDWECIVLDINQYSGSNKVKFIKSDIRDYDKVLKACKNIDIIFHNVAQVPLAKDKNLFDSVNILGTKNILEAASKSGVRKVIYTSSSAVYGIPETNPVSEEMVPRPMEAMDKQNIMVKNLPKIYIRKT